MALGSLYTVEIQLAKRKKKSVKWFWGYKKYVIF